MSQKNKKDEPVDVQQPPWAAEKAEAIEALAAQGNQNVDAKTQDGHNFRKIYADMVEHVEKLKAGSEAIAVALREPAMRDFYEQCRKEQVMLEKKCREWKKGDLAARQAELARCDRRLASMDEMAMSAALDTAQNRKAEYESSHGLFIHDLIGLGSEDIKKVLKKQKDAPAK